ncbi:MULTISPECIES: efflux transporter outer membrane subunit [unclassified Duganella]|uniref:efflux transporter outer membrane subunit n=1 Tax=unclassified Duganella TaxID=2636909 RepID=UPI0006FC772C|nr:MULTISPECIES: efflux transporter outer membrane subunit [unclassified Duganella]KQV53992.1 transporter [Duganella sp. Root336D2]KRB98204.1 transporter [Duganella sp. Root198D2]
MKRSAAAAGVALVLAGCAARIPAPIESQLSVPAQWRSQAAGMEKAALEREWWQAYGDPALSDLVARVLRHNTDVRLAQLRVAEFRARLAAADANRAPTLGATLTPVRTRTLAYNGVPAITNLFAGEFQAAYEIDLWGRLAHASEAAAQSLAAERANADAAQLSVAALAANGYLQLRGLDAQLDLARATLDLREQSRRLAQRQFETGYTSRLEWLQAQAEYEAAAEQVPQLLRQISEQENALSLLAGSSPGPIARGKTLDELSPPVIPVGLPSTLLQRRPDIARAGHGVAAAKSGVQATSEQLLPTLRLTATGGVQSTDFSKFLHDPAFLWRVGAGLAAPVWDGGRVQAQTDAAAAQRDQSLVAYEQTVRVALAEVENSLSALQRLREQTVQNDARRATAAETLRIARNRYRNGYASYLEELDAQRTLFNADVTRLQLRSRLLGASVDLYRALGGGWAGD